MSMKIGSFQNIPNTQHHLPNVNVGYYGDKAPAGSLHSLLVPGQTYIAFFD